MSLCTGISLAVHLSSLEARLNRAECFVKLRTSVFYRQLNGRKVFASPMKMWTTIPSSHSAGMCSSNPQGHLYESKILHVAPGASCVPISEVCEFHIFVNAEAEPTFHIISEMLISTTPDADRNEFAIFSLFSSYQGIIAGLEVVSGYFPASFDDCESIVVHGSLHRCLTDVDFVRLENPSAELPKHYNLYECLNSITCGFLMSKTKQLEGGYFESMSRAFDALQRTLYSIQNVTGKIGRLLPNQKLQREIQQLSEEYARSTSETKSIVAQLLHEELVGFSSAIRRVWSSLPDTLLKNEGSFMRLSRKGYDGFYRKRMSEHITSERILSNQLLELEDGVAVERCLMRASQHWNYESDRSHPTFAVESLKELLGRKTAPKLLESIYLSDRASRRSVIMPEGRTIVVLVHGFQANRWDFLTFQCFLQKTIPNCAAFISTVNQGRTGESIRVLAQNLAQELKQYLAGVAGKYKLTFVGHSMGGIIVREALQYLGGYSPRFHSYISMSSPHLGLHSSGIVGAGLWYLKNWEVCQSIRELALEDEAVPGHCLLYQLSKRNDLRYFQNVVLLSSPQDHYVASQSARAQLGHLGASDFDSAKAQLLNEMACNITAGIECGRLHRITAIFPIHENTFDAYIGRVAHLKFLADPAFIKLFVSSFCHLLA